MDIEEIRGLLDELAAFMEKNNLAELELDVDGAEVKLKKTNNRPQQQAVAQAPTPAGPAPGNTGSPEQPAQKQGTETITSPMVGTFYRAPKPDTDPFVEPDDEVDEDTVLCIIEAMKVMNEIKAEHKGRVAEILAENGEPIEYGQPLFRIVVSD